MTRTVIRVSEAVSLKAAVGQGYDDVFQWKGRYIVIKGSRASKKSKTAALFVISKMVSEQYGNALCIRKTSTTLRNSCFSDCKWAIARLKLQNYFKFRENPLQITYLPTGTVILFRGLDEPLKLTSLSFDVGVLSTIWWEEFYEIDDEKDFNTIDESMRGITPPGIIKQHICTFNPWNEKWWGKKRFFDNPDSETLAKTTTWKINEWIDDADKKLFLNMKKNNPARYRVAGEAEWGVADGVIYENWEELAFDYHDFLGKKDYKFVYGLDFGYTSSASAFVACVVNYTEKTIFVFDEIYGSGMTNKMLYQKLAYKNYAKETIYCDSAAPQSIAELRECGCTRVRRAMKGNDSVMYGIQYLQNFKIYVHPDCKNFIMEISNYHWAKDRFGNPTDKPDKEFDHLLDALRYGVTSTARRAIYSFG